MGKIAVVEATIEPGATGRAQLRGSQFYARNSGMETLQPGERARVEGNEGLLLHIRKSN